MENARLREKKREEAKLLYAKQQQVQAKAKEWTEGKNQAAVAKKQPPQPKATEEEEKATIFSPPPKGLTSHHHPPLKQHNQTTGKKSSVKLHCYCSPPLTLICVALLSLVRCPCLMCSVVLSPPWCRGARQSNVVFNAFELRSTCWTQSRHPPTQQQHRRCDLAWHGWCPCCCASLLSSAASHPRGTLSTVTVPTTSRALAPPPPKTRPSPGTLRSSLTTATRWSVRLTLASCPPPPSHLPARTN